MLCNNGNGCCLCLYSYIFPSYQYHILFHSGIFLNENVALFIWLAKQNLPGINTCWTLNLYQNCHKQNRVLRSNWTQMLCYPKGNAWVKYFWPWSPMGITGAKNPFWGQIEPKWKNDHISYNYYPIRVTHPNKFFPKRSWARSIFRSVT